MAAINSVPKSLHLPLSGLSAPRVLMCHASVGTDSSVTLKLREAHSSAESAKQLISSSSSSSSENCASLDNVLSIDYPDSDMLADVIGTFQTASLKNSSIHKLASNTTSISTTSTSNSAINSIDNTQGPQSANKIGATCVSSTSSSSTLYNGKANSYIKNCLIRSSGCGNNNNNNNSNSDNNSNNNNNNNNNKIITSLAQTMSKSPSPSQAVVAAAVTTTATATTLSTIITSTSTTTTTTAASTSLLTTATTTTHASNTSSVSSSSNFSSNSNDSISSSSNTSSNNSSSTGSTQHLHNKIGHHVALTSNPPKLVKKNRTKALSPTKHGPQQCQICNKIFGNASALAKHKLTHSDERKYVCSMCTKAFKRQDHLNGHMMTHRNKKPYECKADGCNKSYCDARSLRRHTENHHAGANATQTQTISSPISATTTTTGNSHITTTTNKDGSTSLHTYIANGSSLVDTNSGVTLTEDQIKTISLPLNTTVSLLSPASSSSSNSGTSTTSTCPNITVAETPYDGEGLTPKQLDLISQIMQRTKQTSAQVTVSSPTSVNSYKIATSNASPDSSQNSRPRTWNMQLLNQSKKISITVDEIASVELFTKNNGNHDSLSNEPKTLEDELSLQSGALVHPNLLKNDLKPVECNLCHRKFKNIPALNGHMRLHGGYFKKDPEAKKNEKKESNGPPLQTASIGVRALIEEKIINKRSKDLKGSFIVPAPPGSTTSIPINRKTVMEREGNNLICKASTTSTQHQQDESSRSVSPNTNRVATTTTIQLPSATTILNTKQTQSVVCVGTNTSSPSTTKTLSFFPTSTTATLNTDAQILKSSVTELKDSTLIELLKRGTRVAVTHRKSSSDSTNIILKNDNNINKISLNNNNNNNKNNNINNGKKDFEISTGFNNTAQIITNNNRTLIIPADIHMVTKSKNDMNAITSASIHLADGTPVALTITNKNDMNDVADETYTVTYGADDSQLFSDNQVFNISDSEMLVNTVESMQFLADPCTELKSEHSDQFSIDENDDVSNLTNSLNNNNNNSSNNNNNNNNSTGILERLIKVKSNNNANSTTHTFLTSQPASENFSSLKISAAPISANIQTVPLPNFQQFHSKEIVMQTSAQLQAFASPSRSNTLTLPSFTSPMHSPLQYPTPPSSHENMTQSSPFIEDRHNSYMDETTNHFFADKCNLSDFLSQTNQSSNYYKSSEHSANDLQNALNDSDTAFDTPIKVEDLLNGSQDGVLPEFSETNLSFLDDEQLFLNDTQTEASTLSKNFFTGSVDDVKRMLRDVLAEENVIMNSADQRNDNIDLCYITGVGMMPNSDDPLLSSCSHEFGQQRAQDPPESDQQVIQQNHNQQIQPLVSKSLLQQQLQQKPQEKLLLNLHANQLQEKSLIYHQSQTTVLQTGSEKKINEHVPENGDLPVNSSEIQHILSSSATEYIKQSRLLNTKPLHNYEIFAVKNQLMEMAETNHATSSTSIMRLLNETDDRKIGAGKNEKNSCVPQVESTTITTTTKTPEECMTWDDEDAYNADNTQHSTLLSNFPQFSVPPISCYTISQLQPVSNQTKATLKRRLSMQENSNGSNKSYAYQSKLRKPSRTHYTPPPMLNPDREGLGLYRSVRKNLNANSRTFDSFNSEDFSDHIELTVFSDESKVNLGSDYQAQIPQLRANTKTNYVQNMMNCEELLWDPKVQTDEAALDRYINLAKSAGVPLGGHSEENGLRTLLTSNGVISTAVLTLLQTRSNELNTKWSPNDLEVFFRSLEKFGKDFSQISTKVGTKTSGDCVQMYYFWKKICVEKNKLGFKKHSNTINTTDNQSTIAMKERDKPQARQNFKNDLFLNKNLINNSQLTRNNGPISIIVKDSDTNNQDGAYLATNMNHNSNPTTSQLVADIKPFVCEVTDCSASFMSKAALHGHTRIHSTNSKNDSTSQHVNGHTASQNSSACNASKSNAFGNAPSAHACAANTNTSKEICPIQYPCKMCGKVFSKVKSRSAHMKTHRSQDLMATTAPISINQCMNLMIHQQKQQLTQTQTQSQPQTEILRLLQQNNSTLLSTTVKVLEHKQENVTSTKAILEAIT